MNFLIQLKRNAIPELLFVDISRYFGCLYFAGPTRGGSRGGQRLRGPWTLGGHEGAHHWAYGLQRAHQNDTEKSVCGRLKTIFFLRLHQNPYKTVALSPSALDFTKSEIRIVFEQTPGPRSALAPPLPPGYCANSCTYCIIVSTLRLAALML